MNVCMKRGDSSTGAVPIPSSQPGEVPHKTAVEGHDVLGFDVRVQREETTSLSMDMYMIIESILPLDGRVKS
jgi:hypothetical protein